jgi:hypothetical protein
VTTRRAVLDADIIFSRVLHELLGRLAVGPRLFDLVWSDKLLDEQPEVFARVIERQADAWSGGRPVAELLTALGRANVPRLAQALAPLVEPTGQ